MRDCRRQTDAAACGCQCHQPRDAQRQLIAAFGAGQCVHLVHHHAGKPREHRCGVRQRQQHRKAFRRGQQDVRRLDTLARAAVGGRVAGARLDRYRQPHLLDRPRQVARDVGGQRLQRADVQRVDAGTRRLGQFDQGGQESRQRLAAAGRGNQQHAFAGALGIQHRELVLAWRPSLPGEPVGKWFRQCSCHADVLLALASVGKSRQVPDHAASVAMAACPAAGTLLRARRLLHRSIAGGGPRGDHPRAFRPRTPRSPGGAGERRHVGADERAPGRGPGWGG